jgi:hypothetical protein
VGRLLIREAAAASGLNWTVDQQQFFFFFEQSLGGSSSFEKVVRRSFS